MASAVSVNILCTYKGLLANLSETSLDNALTMNCNKRDNGLNVNILREIAKHCHIKGRAKLSRKTLVFQLKKLYYPITIKTIVKPLKLDNILSPSKKSIDKESRILYESLMSKVQYSSVLNLSTVNGSPCLDIRALTRHHKKLRNSSVSLCNYGSSIFIRTSDQDLSTIHIMISGPDATPYKNGLYHFSLCMGSQFPSKPPTVMLLNTSNGRIRHNPNLYSTGKVCLSILGTWTGGQTWSSQRTLYDAIIGIQNYIFSENPYRNEPSFNTTNLSICKAYNHIIRLSTMIDGMLYMMNKPPPEFIDVVIFHFHGPKKYEILQQIQQWKTELVTINHDLVTGYMKSGTYYSDKFRFIELFNSTVSKINDLYEKIM